MAKVKRQTYESVMKKASRQVWPGCGDGRKRWCGSVHNFLHPLYHGGPIMDDFRCTHNHHQGCPQPIPEPKTEETA